MGPLLEREFELELLIAAVDGARAGRGVVVLLAGEAGIGKTSLWRELRLRVGRRSAFLVGGCEALSVPAPLGPVRELLEAAGSDAAPEGDDRFAFARWVSEVLVERAPVVAVIEDVHWADPATVDVIRLLARRIEDVGVVVVVTYRDDELSGNPELAMLVGDLATSPVARRLTLSRLSEDAVRRLADPAGVDAGELLRVTSGNPFLVAEALAAGGVLPASVRDATLSRVGRLGPEARGVVDAAAVIGRRVALDLLAATAPESLEAVEEALSCGVLVEEGDELAFRHELTLQAIEASISLPRRAELHGRVLRALEQHPDVASGHARLAHHAERAGLPVEASRYASLAAADAERVGALREAGLQLERALRLGGGLDPRGRFELLVRLSRAANFEGRMEDALRAAGEAVAVAENDLGAAEQGRALNLLVAALWSLDRVAEARETAKAAIAILETTSAVAELARAHSAYLRVEAVAFDPSVVVAAAPRALELSAAARLEEARIDIEISLGLARGHRGEPQARAQLARALVDARALGLHIQTIRAYVNCVAIAADARDHATLDAVSTEALALFDDYQAAIPSDAVRISIARSRLDRGRWDEASRASERSRREWFGEVPLALVIEGLVRARRGEAGAESLLDQALESAAGVPEGWRHGVIRAALAEAAWLCGDHDAALAQVAASGDPPWARELGRPAAELALWAARHGAHVDPPEFAPEPVLLELAGDWRGAIRAWRDLDAPYEAALAALPGDERAASEAMAALGRLGARAAARAFSRTRAERGLRAPRGPRGSTLANAAGLTRREQEVLTHLARGATNAGIAESLHLSRRTVAHHVSAILSKLDAPTRTAAVGAARTAGLLCQDGPPPRPT